MNGNDSQLKALIFDCFGVIASDGWLPFKKLHFDTDPEKLARATEMNHLVDAGLMHYKDFVREISKLSGVSEAAFDAQIRGYQFDSEILQFIRELKPKFKIAMLSNVSGDWLVSKLSLADRQLFDVISLSYKTGFAKPDPLAYDYVVQQLGLQPGECVFIDDQPGYVAAAEQQGIAGITYQHLDQLKEEFNKRGIY